MIDFCSQIRMLRSMQAPLAYLLRPQSLDDMVGQDSIRQTIRSFLEKGVIPSLIFCGPPGCGKTTLARIIARKLGSEFFELSGVKSKKEDLHAVLELAHHQKAYGKKTLLFLDEIHRWNKAQQDALLPFVESGLVTLIGATTEHPSFTVINALLSRCKVLFFEPLQEEEMLRFFERSLHQVVVEGLDFRAVKQEHLRSIIALSHGDLRSACNLLEASLLLASDGKLDEEVIQQAFGNPLYYDRDGEEHYQLISAVHKSLRDSDPHAACYWIQRMLMGGEDPRYLARRLLRFASEDIGIADHNALLLANQVYDVVMKL